MKIVSVSRAVFLIDKIEGDRDKLIVLNGSSLYFFGCPEARWIPCIQGNACNHDSVGDCLCSFDQGVGEVRIALD